MRIVRRLIKFAAISFLAIIFIAITLSNAYAVEESSSESNVYLSTRLKQIVEFAAPNNQGLNYFILPEASELEKIPADPQNPLTPEKVHLGQLLFHETGLTINPLYPKHWQQGSCATCHFAQAGFRANLPLGLGVGGLGWNKSRHPDPEISYAEVDKQKMRNTKNCLPKLFQIALMLVQK